jgi:hypothetical protein
MKTITHSDHNIIAHGRFELDINCWTVTLYITQGGESAPNVIICTDRLFKSDYDAESYGLEVGKRWVDERREADSEKNLRRVTVGKSSHSRSPRWRSP